MSPITPMTSISLAIRDFALPVPRTGSIEAHSGYGRAAEIGQEIHAMVQQRRAKSSTDYRAEVAISHEFEREGYRFRISGRMDGVFADQPRIEEIKTAFNVRELLRKLAEPENPAEAHPYCLQLKTYGYFHFLQSGVIPRLVFHLVSTRNSESEDLELELDIGSYETWLELRLGELVEETRKSEQRARRRRKAAAVFQFPFASPRPGQLELIRAIDAGHLAKKRMLVQAPTGLGKTVGVLFPVLREALSRGQRVVYVTPKNSQHLVAEDAIGKFQDQGAKIKSLTITAKSKICFKAEPLCNPDFCEYARDYYAKVDRHRLIDLLSKKKRLTSRIFKKLGEEYQVCPFELQLDAAHEAETVICDYNYVFAPRSSFGRMTQSTTGQEGKPNLVIDEAHNLPARAMDYYSPALSTLVLEKMRPSIHELPRRFKHEAEELLDGGIAVLASCRPTAEAGNTSNYRGARIMPPVDAFLEHDAKLRAFLSRYLESDVEIRPKDVVMRLCFYWSEFTAALEYTRDASREEFFVTYRPQNAGDTVKITCCDASAMLIDRYDEYQHVVAFSATLKPFDYYAKLSGLEPERLATSEFHSPFPKSHRKLLIIPQVSTKYSDRERNYSKIADAIGKIASLRPGNYFAFFPSFEFLERVHSVFVPPEGFCFLKQERDARASPETLMEHLRQGSQPTIAFGVQGGTFSEGVDYPGKMLIGAFVIGPPLPNFDLERETMREYYERVYKSGFDYAYAFPAMAKAIQAAGRVIRSETDRGIIVLMDGRFVQPSYSQSMPRDWYESSPNELVSTSILREISEFWANGE